MGQSNAIVKVGVAGAITASLLAGLAKWEGERFNVYYDVVGIPTVCRGITNAAMPGFVIPGKKYTRSECEQAETYIIQHKIIPALTQCRTVPVTQRQHDMLVDFAWNVGTPALCKSTLMRKLNSGSCFSAAEEFLRWDKAGGRVYAGLGNRRAWERSVFLQDCQRSGT